MAKNRRKKRRKRQGGQAVASPPQPTRPGRVAPEARPDVVAARPSGPGSEGTVMGTVVEVEREFIWLDVGGERAVLYASELMLGIGERPADRYAVGDRFEAAVFQMEPNPESGAMQFSIRRASPYPEVLAGFEVGAEVQATVVNTYDAGIELEVDGLRGNAYLEELLLHPSESPHQRYESGETIKGVLVWHVNQATRHLALSIKRNTPGYVEALQRRAVGDVVSATITGFQPNGGLWLNVDGLVGGVLPRELALNDGESARERYAVGETIDGLLVQQVNHEARVLALSAKRNVPGYVEALQRHAVGDVVSATIAAFTGIGGLWLDVDGLVGGVQPWELVLANEESVRERYTVGQTIDKLFVWRVDHRNRVLNLSVRRNGPGYVGALQRRTVGDVVSATITHVGEVPEVLLLDVDGLLGVVSSREIALSEGESTREHYIVGETINGLFVWRVDHENRLLALSAKRNAPGYMEALQRRAVGDEVSGTVTDVLSAGLWLEVDGAIGWIFKEEALLEDGEALAERYSVGDSITAVVRHVDRASRTVLLSARQSGLALVEEPIVLGATIKVMVARKRDGGIDVSVGGGSEVGIPDYALSLRPGGSAELEMGQEIDVVVMGVEDGVPTVLSHRRALAGWEAARDRLAAGFVVPDARVIPWVDRPNRDDGPAAVDLGPITGFIRLNERDAAAVEDLMNRRANRRHGIVIEALDEEVWTASVSEAKFEARWQELADSLPTDEGVEGEVIDITRGVATLDLGFGLLGEMPVNGDERIGEVVTVGIRSVDREEYRIVVESGAYRLAEMIAGNESATCEFKAVFQGQREGDSKEVRSGYPVARAMAGMMNQAGGHVLVGVYEDQETKKGKVIGWEESGFDTEDAFVTELANVVGRMLSTEAGGLYDVRFEALPGGKRIADIVCRPAERPIFTRNVRHRGAPAKFFVRYEAATRQPADGQDDRELYEYIQGRFYGREA